MIILGFYEGISALSKVIRWETRSDISHVSILQIPDNCLRPHSREILWHRLHDALDVCPLWEAWASEGVVRRSGIHEGHKPGTRIHLMRLESEFNFDLDETAVTAFLDKCVQRGLKYDWWGLVRFAFRIDRNNKNRMFCSELAHLAMMEGGVPLLRRVGAHFVAPADLYRSPLLTELLAVHTKKHVESPRTRRDRRTAVGPSLQPEAQCTTMHSGSRACFPVSSAVTRDRQDVDGVSARSGDKFAANGSTGARTADGLMGHSGGMQTGNPPEESTR